MNIYLCIPDTDRHQERPLPHNPLQARIRFPFLFAGTYRCEGSIKISLSSSGPAVHIRVPRGWRETKRDLARLLTEATDRFLNEGTIRAPISSDNHQSRRDWHIRHRGRRKEMDG